jgi:tRNA dimethylallyltransferase
VDLAERFSGEVINADSLQVYRHLDIGTGKPTAEERSRAVHHLLDVAEPGEPFSAGDYVARARKVLEGLAARGRVAVLCGGTGFYFRALMQGMAEVPPVPDAVRRDVAARMQRLGAPGCHVELARLDPERAARLHPNDAARIARALEVVLASGVPLSAWLRRGAATGVAAPVLHVGWLWERHELYARINRRVEEMLAQGWVDEVRRVLAMGVPPSAKPLRAIGYREIVEYLEGRRPLTSLAPDIQQRTRHYAKRQLTWFRRQAPVEWFSPHQREALLRRAAAFLDAAATRVAP